MNMQDLKIFNDTAGVFNDFVPCGNIEADDTKTLNFLTDYAAMCLYIAAFKKEWPEIYGKDQ